MKLKKVKRILSLVMALSMCLAFIPSQGFAAPADMELESELTEGATVNRDENSPTGYTVTFVYFNDTAVRVELESPHMIFRRYDDTAVYNPLTWERDMFIVGNDSAPFRIDMVKDENNLWTVSFPLPSGGYSYRYRINRPASGTTGSTIVEDPANPGLYPPAPHASDPHSTVQVPFDEDKQLYDYTFVVPVNDVPKGTVEFFQYDYAGTARSVAVYLPPDHDKNREEPYKVQFVSHGMGGWETEWMHKGLIPVMMDNMIAKGEVEPYIVVSVNNTQFNFMQDTATASIIDATLNYLLPILVERYNASTEAKDLAYSGFSMGGQLTARILRDAPTEFGYFGMWSGDDWNITAATWADNVASLPQEDKPVVMFSMGNYDMYRANFYTDQFVARLNEAGVEFGDHSDWPGGHDWMFWHRSFYVFATEYLWKEESGVQSVRPITEVRWWGQQVGGVVLEFAVNVDASTLTAEDFGIQDTAYNTSFDPSSVATSRAMLVDQPIKDVFTVADPSLLLTEERPEAPGRYLVVTVDLDNTWFGRSISLLGGMYVRMNLNPPTEITIKKNIYSAGGTLLAEAGETPLTMTDVPVVNRGVDEYTQDVFNAAVGTELYYSYRLPENYDPVKEYPLVVYLTGMGQGYTVSGGVNNLGVNIATEASSQFWFSDEFKEEFGKDVIFLAPQSTRSLSVAVQAEQVAELIEDFSKEFAVDTRRVYFYTLSYGGRLGWWLAANRPDLFAAVMPTSFDQLTAAQAAAIAEAELPVCMVAGVNDHLMTYSITTAQRDMLLTAYRDRGVSEERIAELVKWHEFDHEDFDRVGVPCPVEWVGTDNHYMAGYPGAYNVDNLRSRRDQHISLIPALRDTPEITEWLLAQAKPLALTEGATVTEDPDSPTGYTVTFVYRNENATGVRLAGDLTLRDVSDTGTVWYQPEVWQTGRYHVGGTEFTRAMTYMGDGYWTVSIPMHAGGLSYWYRVDNPAQNWTNKRIWDPTATHPRPPEGNSYRETRNDVLGAVYVPYDEKQNDPALESRAAYELPRENPAERGSVTYLTYTNINGAADYLGVYLPAGYDADRAEPYKVMYLSHGIYGDETDWMVPGNAPNILDNMIASGEIEPTILVTTGNHLMPNRSYNTTTAANNIANVVIPFMEANYNVSAERDGRAYGGFSMGGMTGGPMMNLHADKFAYFGFFSGNPSGPNYDTIAGLASGSKTFVMLGNGSFEGALTSFNTVRDNLRNIGIDSETHQVPGAHDMMTAGQLFTIFAKEYLWKMEEPMVEGATVVADPDSPTGYTVTFVYKNENATGVRLAGDLTQRDINDPLTPVVRYQPEDWKTGRYHTGGTEFLRDMTYVGDGYWTVSIPMHAGGLSYWYRVDDPAQDWTNKRIWDPAASHPRPEDLGSVTTYRTVNNDVLGAVYVPYDAKQNDPTLESRAKYELPAEVQGTVTYVAYTPWTPAEYPDLRQPGEDYYLGVYLPPGYDENRAEPYPVVYLNHGVYGDETDWMVPGNAPNIIDNLIAAGEIEPTVVVTMGNHFSTVPRTGSGLPENGYNPPTAARNIVNAILPFVEANYNVSTDASGRAVGGFSYGGTTTWNVLYEYADLFGFFGFFSAAGSLSTDQLGNIQEKAAGEARFAMIGNGIFEGALSNSGRDSLRSIGFESETHQVPGAHDMMTAGQLFTIFARDYLWKADEAKADVAITSTIKTIVAGYAANLPADVVFLGEPVSFELGLYDPDGKLLRTINVSENGRYMFRIEASEAVAGIHTIKALGAADGVSIDCVEQPEDLWAPVVTVDGNTVTITFASEVTFNEARKSVKVGGATVANSRVSVSGKVITITGVTVAEGQQIVIAGVKYADLFPSYSFTFTLSIP